MSAKRAYLGLGSNLGDRRENLLDAIRALEAQDIRMARRSSFYETEPQDVTDQPWFLNLAVECETRFFPVQLMSVLLRTEAELGRIRGRMQKGGPRKIDLDILLFGQAVIDTTALQVPHPRLTERRFVLEPLVEISPDLRHPVTRVRLTEYLDRLKRQRVKRLD